MFDSLNFCNVGISYYSPAAVPAERPNTPLHALLIDSVLSGSLTSANNHAH